MALERRRVEKDHLRALFRLKVAEDQAGLVAPNEITLAQAAYEAGSHVWGLWEGDTAVGLIAMIHPHEAGGMEEGEDPDAAYIWRLMIGAEYQGKGHGRAALDLAIGQGRDWGLPRIALSVVQADNSAIAMYEAAGFRRTGKIIEDEIVLSRDL